MSTETTVLNETVKSTKPSVSNKQIAYLAFGAFAILAFLGFLVWYWTFVTSVDKHEFAFIFDRVSGTIEPLDKSGWIIRTPLRYSVHKIDLRPHQVTISANQRILNAKLVKFDPKGLQTFVEWHGRNAGDSVKNLEEILKCYAFDSVDGRDCPFLEVLQGSTPNQGVLKPLITDLKGEK